MERTSEMLLKVGSLKDSLLARESIRIFFTGKGFNVVLSNSSLEGNFANRYLKKKKLKNHKWTWEKISSQS